MARSEYELGAVSSPDDEHPCVPKTHPTNEVTVQDSPRSSITMREPAASVIPSRFFPFLILIMYSLLALLSWILLCVMSKRPIKGERTYTETESSRGERRFATNEKYYTAARILQSVVGLLTIPVTSAICSIACVAYMQTGRLRKSLTLRQAMAMADQGWINPRMWTRLASKGSLPLYVAFTLTLIGCLFQVLQGAFIEQESIMAGSSEANYVSVADLPPMIGDSYDSGNHALAVTQLRGLLETTDRRDYDLHLWSDATRPGMKPMQIGSVGASENDTLYVAPIPVGFNSGAYPEAQYAPRINSSLQYHNVTQDEWKRECRNETDNGGFYARYEYVDDLYDWDTSFEACMTRDIRNTPWNRTRDRQEIVETLYLRISLPGEAREPPETGNYFKSEVTSTLGYFEVPSQANGNRPGPLMTWDPIPSKSKQFHRYYPRWSKRETNTSYAGNQTLMHSNSKGPLTSLVLALFGPDSFVASRLSNATAFIVERPKDDEGRAKGYDNCVALDPLGNLFSPESAVTLSYYENREFGCISDSYSLSEPAIIASVHKLLRQFITSDKSTIGAPLEAGLVIANRLWLRQGNRAEGRLSLEDTLEIHYDEGIPTIKPKISATWLVVGSFLLGLHLTGLALLTLYIWAHRPWMGTMGADVMVRMGVVHADVLGGLGDKEFETMASQIPGFVGDERPGETVGRIRAGAQAGLVADRERRYEALR